MPDYMILHGSSARPTANDGKWQSRSKSVASTKYGSGPNSTKRQETKSKRYAALGEDVLGVSQVGIHDPSSSLEEIQLKASKWQADSHKPVGSLI
ncbi:hypothetical protein ACEQPO_02235 [Bacillus sp. SL00103]